MRSRDSDTPVLKRMSGPSTAVAVREIAAFKANSLKGGGVGVN